MFLRTKSNRKNTRRQLFRRILACESLEQRNLMATISGVVFNDQTLNGFTADDGRVQGARVVITNSGGTTVSDQITAANGGYSVLGLPAGTYQVAFTPPTNFRGVPGTPLTQTVVLATGASDGGAIVGMYRLGEVRGYKFVDQNLDGIDAPLPADPVQGGVTFTLVGAGPDNNFNTLADNTTQTSVTNPATGEFVFPNLAIGSYRLSENAGANFARTTANFTDIVVNASGQLFVPNATFGVPGAGQTRVVNAPLAVGNYRLGEIRGFLFLDQNINGAFNPPTESIITPVPAVGAPDLDDFTIVLTNTTTNAQQTLEKFPNGEFAFRNLPIVNGGITYRLVVTPRAGSAASSATTFDFTFNASGQVFVPNAAFGTIDTFQTRVARPELAIGIYELGSIRGFTFIDNANVTAPLGQGLPAAGDTRTLLNQALTVSLVYAGANGVFDGNDLRASLNPADNPPAGQLLSPLPTYDANGAFRFNSLLAGRYRLTASAKTGWIITSNGAPFDVANIQYEFLVDSSGKIIDAPSAPNVLVPYTTTGTNTDQRLAIGAFQLATVGGFAFNDLNGNGVADTDNGVADPRLPNQAGDPAIRMQLLFSGPDFVFNGAESTTVFRETSTLLADGRFGFVDLRPGVYRLRVNPADIPIANALMSSEPYRTNGFFEFTVAQSGIGLTSATVGTGAAGTNAPVGSLPLQVGIFRYPEIYGYVYGDFGDDGLVEPTISLAPNPNTSPNVALPAFKVDILRRGTTTVIKTVNSDAQGRFSFKLDVGANATERLLNRGDYDIRAYDATLTPTSPLNEDKRVWTRRNPNGTFISPLTPSTIETNIATYAMPRIVSGSVLTSTRNPGPYSTTNPLDAYQSSILATPLPAADPRLDFGFAFLNYVNGRVVLDNPNSANPNSPSNGFDLIAGLPRDPGIGTFTVSLTYTPTGSTTPISQTSTSDANGLFQFKGLRRGSYTVTLVNTNDIPAGKPNYESTTANTVQLDGTRLNRIFVSDNGRVPPLAAAANFTDPRQSDQTVRDDGRPVTVSKTLTGNNFTETLTTTSGLGFAVRRLGAIYGSVFNDANKSGIQDAAEVNLAGVRVRLFSVVNNIATEVTSITPGGPRLSDTAGFVFENLRPGNYVVTASYIDGNRLDNSLGIILNGIVQPNQTPGQATRGQTTPNVSVTTNYNEIDTRSLTNDPRAIFERGPGLIRLDNLDSNNARLAIGISDLVEVTGTLSADANVLSGKTVLLKRTLPLADLVNQTGPANSAFNPDTLPSVLRTTTAASGKYSFYVWPGSYEVAEVLTSELEPATQTSNATGVNVSVSQRRFDVVSQSVPAPVSGGPNAKVAWSSLQDLDNDGLDDLIVVNERANPAIQDSQGNVQVSYAIKDNSGKVSFGPATTYWLGKNARPQQVASGLIYKNVTENGKTAKDIVIALSSDTTRRAVSQISIDGQRGRAFGGVLILKNLSGRKFELVDPMTNAAPEIVSNGVLVKATDATDDSVMQRIDWRLVNTPNTLPGEVSSGAFKSIGGNAPVYVTLFEVNNTVALAISNSISYDISIPGRPNVTGHEDVSIALLGPGGKFSKASIVNFSTPSLAAGVTSTSVYKEGNSVVLAAALSKTSTVATRTWVGSGFTTSNSSQTSFSSPLHVVFADLNNDGKLNDLVVAGIQGVIAYSVSPGGNITSPKPVSTKSNARYVAVGDINGDSRNDLAVSYSSDGSFQYFINLGVANNSFSNIGEKLSFKPSVPILPVPVTPAGATSRNYVSQVALGKLNSNGFADLVATHLIGGVTIHANSELAYDEWLSGISADTASSTLPGPGKMRRDSISVLPTLGQGIVRHLSPITIAKTQTADAVRDFGHFGSGSLASVANTIPAVSASTLRAEGEANVGQYDINGDGFVTPLDALLVINSLNSRSKLSAVAAAEGEVGIGDQRLDANGDGSVTPLDALVIINKLNQRPSGASTEITLQSLPSSVAVPTISSKKLASLATETDLVFASDLGW